MEPRGSAFVRSPSRCYPEARSDITHKKEQLIKLLCWDAGCEASEVVSDQFQTSADRNINIYCFFSLYLTLYVGLLTILIICITILLHIYVYLFIFIWPNSPQWVMASLFTRFLDHTQRRTTVGRTSLDKWSARRRDLYLKTHNTHNRQTSMTRWDSKPRSQQASGRRPTP